MHGCTSPRLKKKVSICRSEKHAIYLGWRQNPQIFWGKNVLKKILSRQKKIFFLIIHLFFLSGSCKTCTSDVVVSVLCCKLAETLDLRKIKQSTPECNETLHCNGKGKILHMIFFSTPGQILQLLNLHYIWHQVQCKDPVQEKMPPIFVFSKSWARIFLRNRS